MAVIATKIVLVDGIQVPAMQVSAVWSANGETAMNVVVPYTQEVRALKEGSQVQVYHVTHPGPYRKRKVLEVAEDESGFARRGETLGDVVDVPLRGPLDQELELPTSVPLYALQYMGGGELIAKSIPRGAQGPRTVTLAVQGYDHLLSRMTAIQLTRGRGTLNETERRILGQAQAVFTSTGRRGFANDLNAFIGEHPDNMLGALHRVVTRYARRLSPYWGRRFFQTRTDNQFVYYEGDTTVNRLLGANAFTRFLREQTQQMYTAPLGDLIQVLLAFVHYRMVSIPFPAYFPAYVPDPPEFEDVVVGERVRQRGGGLYLEITWPGFDTFTFPEELSEFARRNGRLEVRGSDRFWTWLQPPQQEEDSVQLIPTNFRSLRRERADLIENNLLGRWTVPQGAFLGGNEVFFYVSAVEPGRATLNFQRPPFRLIPFREGEVFAFRGRIPPGLAAIDRALGGAIARAFSLRLEVKRDPVRTVVEPIIERRQIPRAPIDSDVGRGKDVLASYAFVPYLWWASPPACNIIIPEMITSSSETLPGANRITRLMGKLAPGRSGSSSVRGDRFLAPRSQDLQQEFSETNHDPRDPDEWAPHEMASGPAADVYYFELLHRLVRDSDWETYLQSFIQQEFWSRRLAPQSLVLELAHTYHISPGFPAMAILDSGQEERSPEYRALTARIAALRDAIRSMRECLRRFRDPPNSAAVLRSYISNLLAIRVIGLQVGLKDRITPPSGGAVNPATIASAIRDVPPATSDAAVAALFRSQANKLLPGGERVRTSAQGITRAMVERHISDPEALVLVPLNGGLVLSRYPTEAELRRWYGLIRQARSLAPCREALREDIALAERALAETRATLGRYGVGKGPQVVIGYVESVQTSAPRNRTSVTLTHCRYVGEDIAEDLVDNDDLENVIAFGEDGFMDTAYRSDSIGKKVYPGILGCESVAEVAAEFDREQEELLEEVDGLRTDIQDVVDQFRHPEVCGHTCVNPTERPASTINDAVRAVYEEYLRLKESGAGSAELIQWILRIQHRAPLLFSDAYRGTEVTLGAKARTAPFVEDIRRDDPEVYEDGVAVEGFFNRSFLNPAEPAGQGEEFARLAEDSDLTEEEKDFLFRRTQAILRYLESVADGGLTE